jgi:hypothetical protein
MLVGVSEDGDQIFLAHDALDAGHAFGRGDVDGCER